jgi:hypothetical protein
VERLDSVLQLVVVCVAVDTTALNLVSVRRRNLAHLGHLDLTLASRPQIVAGNVLDKTPSPLVLSAVMRVGDVQQDMGILVSMMGLVVSNVEQGPGVVMTNLGATVSFVFVIIC